MEITLKMIPEKPLVVPFNYFYQLQSSIYALLGTVSESDFWHDVGFGGAAKFKGFCFSGLKGSYKLDRDNKKLIFGSDVFVEVRSPVFEFIDAFQRAVEHLPSIKLFDTRLDIVFASLSNTHLSDGITRFTAVTPVVVHEELPDGHTVYFSPDEAEYFIRLCGNIEKKFSAINNKTPEQILLRPAGELKKVVTKYKETWITGYTGDFEINAAAKTAEFIFSAGLGEKNSQGFGFLELKR